MPDGWIIYILLLYMIPSQSSRCLVIMSPFFFNSGFLSCSSFTLSFIDLQRKTRETVLSYGVFHISFLYIDSAWKPAERDQPSVIIPSTLLAFLLSRLLSQPWRHRIQVSQMPRRRTHGPTVSSTVFRLSMHVRDSNSCSMTHCYTGGMLTW
jgi:hypothetical protein